MGNIQNRGDLPLHEANLQGKSAFEPVFVYVDQLCHMREELIQISDNFKPIIKKADNFTRIIYLTVYNLID